MYPWQKNHCSDTFFLTKKYLLSKKSCIYTVSIHFQYLSCKKVSIDTASQAFWYQIRYFFYIDTYHKFTNNNPVYIYIFFQNRCFHHSMLLLYYTLLHFSLLFSKHSCPNLLRIFHLKENLLYKNTKISISFAEYAIGRF